MNERDKVARRCAEIVGETRLLSRDERVFHADPGDVRGLLDCAYKEAAYRILLEFGLVEPRVHPGGVSSKP